jgi:uroporphyrinogen decarboxylase
LKEKSGDFLVIPSGYTGAYERAAYVTGWENFMTLIGSDRDLIEELLDKATDYKIGVAKKTVQLGFKIAHTCDELGSQQGGIFSDRTFHDVLLPRMKRHWKVFTDAGIPIMFHSCGNITRYIPSLLDIGLSVLEPCPPLMDLGYLKREFGRHLVLMGGIDAQALPFINAEQTRELTRNTIRTLGQGGGYIIAPSQSIMNDVPIENIKALVETIGEERARV